MERSNVIAQVPYRPPIVMVTPCGPRGKKSILYLYFLIVKSSLLFFVLILQRRSQKKILPLYFFSLRLENYFPFYFLLLKILYKFVIGTIVDGRRTILNAPEVSSFLKHNIKIPESCAISSDMRRCFVHIWFQ